jgi:anti-anti-sigma factor
MAVHSIQNPASAGQIPSHGGAALACDRVQMRAQCRHLATVVTIAGAVDAANIDSVSDYVRRFALVGNALILDLSNVTFLAAQGISMFVAIDDTFDAADLAWLLVPGRTVSRLLRIGDMDNLVPTASSVSEAIGHFVDALRARNRVLPPLSSTVQRQTATASSRSGSAIPSSNTFSRGRRGPAA